MEIITFIIILLFSVIFHEVAHGLMAERLGDPTARYAGRLTLNPIPHIDPIGSILLPALMWFATAGQFVLGAAKPVPVDYRNFRDVKLGMILVSIVGPLTNFVLAVLAAMVLRFTPNLSETGIDLLLQVILLNLVLTVFNMIPMPPLDGSKVLAGILGYFNRDWMHWFLELERFGFILVILLLVTGVLSRILIPPVEFLLRFLVGVN
jgi:Zn-dependent protease